MSLMVIFRWGKSVAVLYSRGVQAEFHFLPNYHNDRAMVFKLRCREQDAENSRECMGTDWTKRDLNILTEHSKLK